MTDIYSVYNKTVNRRAVKDRLEDGANATLELWDTGWLVKTDRPGEDFVSHEYEIYSLIDELGLAGVYTPECALEEGVFGHPNSFVIARINDCASLYEYALECGLHGAMTKDLWYALCTAVGTTVAGWHAAGFIHHDLHGGNVVVSVEKGEWRPFVIDFGVCSHAECPCEYLNAIGQAETAADDCILLVESLKDYAQRVRLWPWFNEGLCIIESLILN